MNDFTLKLEEYEPFHVRLKSPQLYRYDHSAFKIIPVDENDLLTDENKDSTV